jgi:hypothetical protein
VALQLHLQFKATLAVTPQLRLLPHLLMAVVVAAQARQGQMLRLAMSAVRVVLALRHQ